MAYHEGLRRKLKLNHVCIFFISYLPIQYATSVKLISCFFCFAVCHIFAVSASDLSETFWQHFANNPDICVIFCIRSHKRSKEFTPKSLLKRDSCRYVLS